MSGFGTKRTCSLKLQMSVVGGRTDMIGNRRHFRFWTHNGHPACMGKLRSSNVLCPELELLSDTVQTPTSFLIYF